MIECDQAAYQDWIENMKRGVTGKIPPDTAPDTVPDTPPETRVLIDLEFQFTTGAAPLFLTCDLATDTIDVDDVHIIVFRSREHEEVEIANRHEEIIVVKSALAYWRTTQRTIPLRPSGTVG